MWFHWHNWGKWSRPKPRETKRGYLEEQYRYCKKCDKFQHRWVE